MITVEAALETVLARITPLGAETVTLTQALDRVLAEDVHAACAIPPYDNSAMDGYAVRQIDIATAPVTLPVAGELAAGDWPDRALTPGTAMRIMTGAPIPPGADLVVRQEDTTSDEGGVRVLTAQPAGTNIRRTGEDVRPGTRLFARSTLLGPAHLGVLASLRRAVVAVYQAPRVAILSTGNELQEIDAVPERGKIVNSNTYSLSALVQRNRGTPLALGIARDDPAALRARLEQGLSADIIITSAGVSVGEYDFVKTVLDEMGMEMHFWKVAMRPGQPFTFGTIAGRPVFGLPGNPVSAMISFEQFVRPAMRKMSGLRQLFRPTLRAIADEAVETGRDKKYFIRCRLERRHSGWHATTTGAQGSGILMSMADAQGLMIVPEEVETVQAGDQVTVQVLDPEIGFTAEPVY